jgi:hypothetical protein
MNVMQGWRRRACAVAAGATTIITCTGGAALAQSVTTNSKKSGAGTTAVTACGTLTSVVVNYAVTTGEITAILLTSIPSSCIGGQLSMTLSQSGTDVGHAGPTDIAATSLTLVPSVLTTPDTTPTEVRMSVVGP